MPGALDWLMRQLGGDPEAEGAAQMSTAMQPAVLLSWRNSYAIFSVIRTNSAIKKSISVLFSSKVLSVDIDFAS